MRQRFLLGLLALAAVAPPLATAQDTATKQEIIDQSGAICGDALVAISPHLREMREAEQQGRRRKFVRHGRRMVRKARRFVRDLDALQPPPEGRRRYERFVNKTDAALDSLSGAFDALASKRFRLAEDRAQKADGQLDRARAAARRYGLRDSCITFVS